MPLDETTRRRAAGDISNGYGKVAANATGTDVRPLFESHGSLEFRAITRQQLGFRHVAAETFDLYVNDQGGFSRSYGREGFYHFGVADYTIPHPFAVHFRSPGPLLRFGTMYDGKTQFHIANIDESSFMPSVFVTLEQDLEGAQEWEAGQHFSGAEFSVYPAFIAELGERFPELAPIDLARYLVVNRTYRYLPIDLIAVLGRVTEADREGRLTPLALEAAVIECVAILLEANLSDAQRQIGRTVCPDSVRIGANRKINLSAEDIECIERAHDILQAAYAHPPTLERLSSELAINPQKLKAGFKRRYHTTPGAFVTMLRMSRAALLLRTTDETVGTVASTVGYANASNFIKAFTRAYSCTPQRYRLREGKGMKRG